MRRFQCRNCSAGIVIFCQIDTQEPVLWAYICQNRDCQRIYVECGVYRAAAIEVAEGEIADPGLEALMEAGPDCAVRPSTTSANHRRRIISRTRNHYHLAQCTNTERRGS
jgi:hypothetical protein